MNGTRSLSLFLSHTHTHAGKRTYAGIHEESCLTSPSVHQNHAYTLRRSINYFYISSSFAPNFRRISYIVADTPIPPEFPLCDGISVRSRVMIGLGRNRDTFRTGWGQTRNQGGDYPRNENQKLTIYYHICCPLVHRV